MLTAAQRAQLTVVLVGARNPQNIGAAARALHDFGFSDLRVVNPFAAPFEAAQLEASGSEPLDPATQQIKSAVSAREIMLNARRFDTLSEAIADCALVAGTTAIGDRELRQQVIPLQQAAPQILSALVQGGPPQTQGGPSQTQGGPFMTESHPVMSGIATIPSTPKTALLFGSEKTGLTNDQLSHCSLLTTIPMFQPEDTTTGEPSRHLSMNLGQSVAVCLYELTRQGFENTREIPILHEAPATAEDRDRLTQLLVEVVHTTGYSRRYPHNSAEPLLRQLALQLGSNRREAMMWMGVLRQILRHETT
ncbi:MAG: TrmH family RNA methyltransferase [Acidobacteriota bacterium]